MSVFGVLFFGELKVLIDHQGYAHLRNPSQAVALFTFDLNMSGLQSHLTKWSEAMWKEMSSLSFWQILFSTA